MIALTKKGFIKTLKADYKEVSTKKRKTIDEVIEKLESFKIVEDVEPIIQMEKFLNWVHMYKTVGSLEIDRYSVKDLYDLLDEYNEILITYRKLLNKNNSEF